MSIYVLIHGACSGGWCWEKVVPLLKQAGHIVEAPDLPGHGQDKTPLREVTLAAYTRRVCETLDAQAEPVILLGYSMGGLAITSVAEERSGKINTLVYLTAYLVQHGESLAQVISRNTDTLLGANLNKEQGYFTVKEETLREAVFADCSDEDFERARSRLGPQPIAPLMTPVGTTVENFGRVPKVYIECLRDRAIPPAFQKKMYTTLPFQKILSLESSHSPFYSVPEELVRLLISL